MPLEFSEWRKVGVLKWDADEIHGADASIQVAGEEKRTVKNDGESNLFFPLDFEGEVEVTVKGSHSGEETKTLHVPAA